MSKRDIKQVAITATKRMTFEAAHYLEGYDGKCGHLHGHSYAVEVTVGSERLSCCAQEQGMVMDLTQVKAIAEPYIDQLDHALLVERENAIVDLPSPKGEAPRVVVLGMRPTTENLGLWLFDRLDRAIADADEGCFLVSLRIRETETSWIEVKAQ